MSGTLTQPQLPSPPVDHLNSPCASGPEKDKYDVAMKVYLSDYSKWEETDRLASSILILNIEFKTRLHIRNIAGSVHKFEHLIKLYEDSDTVIIDKALWEISRSKSEDYSTIYAYAEHIKKWHEHLIAIEKPLPNWELSAFFRLGLAEDSLRIVVALTRFAETMNKDLTIDDMVVALSVHDKRVTHSEETAKSMAATFGKQSKSKRKGNNKSSTKSSPGRF